MTFIRPVSYGIPVFLMTSMLFMTVAQVKAYGPQNESCTTSGSETNGKTIRPASYGIIAGLTISATGGTGDSVKVATSASNPHTGIVLRHNKFIGNAVHSQIRLVGNVTDTTITGNDIQHARGKSVPLRLRNSGSMRPHDIAIDGNKFSNCGEDCVQPESGGSFTLSDNYFVGPADENLIDVKSVQDDSFIFNNVFECKNSPRVACCCMGQMLPEPR